MICPQILCVSTAGTHHFQAITLKIYLKKKKKLKIFDVFTLNERRHLLNLRNNVIKAIIKRISSQKFKVPNNNFFVFKNDQRKLKTCFAEH